MTWGGWGQAVAQVGELVYGFVLLAYPPDIQREFRDDMRFAFHRRSREALRKGGFRALLGWWVRTALDLAVSLPREWTAFGSTTTTELLREIRFAARRLARRPAFTAATTLTLAIGLGSATAIFALLHGVLLRPLPFPEPDRLVAAWHTAPGAGSDRIGQTDGTYFAYREASTTLADIALWTTHPVTITGGGPPERVDALAVTDGFLGVLGVSPVLGRGFEPEDGLSDSEAVVLLGHGYWQRRFGGDPSVLGNLISVDDGSAEVVGILPADFRFMDRDPPLLIPLRLDQSRASVGGFNYSAVARLGPKATVTETEADLARLVAYAVGMYPGGNSLETLQKAGFRPVVVPLKQELVGDVESILWVLLGAVGIVLVAACSNVANLFVVRGEARRPEVGVLLALGARPSRIASGFLLEGGLIAGLAGVMSVGLAWGGVRLMQTFAPDSLPRLLEIRLSGEMVLFSLALALLAGPGVSLVSALRHGRSGATATGGMRFGLEGPAPRRMRSALAATQIALALILLVGAGLLARTLDALWRVDPGFDDPREVLTFALEVPPGEGGGEEVAARAHEEIARRIEAIAGVESVGLSTSVPMDGRWFYNRTHVQGIPRDPVPSRRFKFVSGGYFETMGIRLLAGRSLSWDDVRRMAPVAVVNESFAREYWNDPYQAVGHRIALSPGVGWREIVGVVEAVLDDGPARGPTPLVYWPMAVSDFWGQTVLVMRNMRYAVRGAEGAPTALLGSIREAVSAVNPNLPLMRVRTQQAIVEASLARTTFTMTLMGIAAAVAFLLGTVGLYAAIAYIVSVRKREIGVRLAMGADPSAVTAMVVRQGLTLAAWGVALGLLSALGLSRLLEGLLFGVRPLDPATYAVMVVTLCGTALLASYVPARRAAALDPAQALRHE